MNQKNTPKTKGTVMAEKIRAKANQLPDETREQLLERARQLIHGAGGKTRAHRG